MRNVFTKRKVATALCFVLAVGLATTLSHTPARVYGDTNGRIAYSTSDGTNDQIYTIAADGSGKTQLTHDADANALPEWSPDGTKIAYLSFSGAHIVMKTMNADGTNQTTITDGQQNDYLQSWSPDGTKFAFVSDENSNNNLEIMNADGT